MRKQLCNLLALYAGQTITQALAVEIVGRLMPESPSVHSAPDWELWSPAGLLELVCGDKDAARFICDVASCSHTYDDLIDQDKPASSAAIHKTMWSLLVGMPGNPFFAKHQDSLRPILTTAILNWRAANDMEQSGSLEELRIAHSIRYALSDVLLMCMVLTGGAEHAAANARRARLMGQNDTWAHYRAEHLPKEKSDAV